MQILRKFPFLGLLVLLWIISIGIVNPNGDFPLNDDWAFAEGVYSIVETGSLVPSDWPAMTLVAQLYWGALFCKVFGLSGTVLRWCTLLSSLVAIITFYLLGCEMSKRRPLVAFATLVLFFNPLFFSLSFTFMTDVHFLCAILLAFFFFSKEIKTTKLGYWLLGTFFSIVATLIRQPGLMIPLTYALVALLQQTFRTNGLIKAIAPLGLSVFAYLGYMQWLSTGNEAAQTVHIIDHLVQGVLSNNLAYFLERTVTVLLYMGLFLSPFVLFTLRSHFWTSPKLTIWKIGLTVMLLVVLYIGSTSFPFGNVLYNLGLGPKILKDTYWGDNIHPQLSLSTWKAMAYPSILITTLLALRLALSQHSLRWTIRGGPLQAQRLIRLAVLSVLVIYVLFLIIGPYLFDRYTLPLLAFGLLYFLPYDRSSFSKLGQKIAWVGLLGFALFSLFGTQHYLSWNRTRWQALDQLMREKKVAATKIDGGFEFNTWLKTGPFHKEDRYGKSWWRVAEDEYVLTFGRMADFEVREIHPIQAVWPFHRDSLFVLWHKVDGMTSYEDYPIKCGAEELAADPTFFRSNLPQVRFHHGQAQSDEKAHRGRFAMKFSEGMEYGFSTVLKDIQPNDDIKVTIWRWDERADAGLVISSHEGERFFHFERAKVVEVENGWEQLEINIKIPDDPGFDQLGIYVWNPSKNEVWFDDLTIDRRPHSSSINTME